MKQKRTLICKEKKKTKNEYRYQETKLDIYDLEDEDGVKLGQHLENLQKEIDKLNRELYAEKQRRLQLIKALKGANK